MSKDILMFGGGAIAALYGGILSQSGQNVSVVCRSNLQAVNDAGYHIKSVLGDFSFKPEYVLSSSDTSPKHWDYVVVCLKACSDLNVESLIAPFISDNTTIVLLQNGLHIEEPVYHAFPNHILLSALAFVCVNQTSPGYIHHLDYGMLQVAEYPAPSSPVLTDFVSLFSSSKIKCKAIDNVKSARWEKLIWNAAFNPISILAGGITTLDILSNPFLKAWVRDVMSEVYHLASLDGVCLPEDIIELKISQTENMAPYKTSMLLDFEAKRPLEADAILGNAISFARSKNVSVPAISYLYGVLSTYNSKI